MDHVTETLELARQLAQAFEGLHRLGPDGLVYPYHDPVGFPTQGYGRLLSRQKGEDLSKYPPITVAQAEAWLEEDLLKFYRGVNRLLTTEVTPEQMAALVDFAFNVGLGNLQASTLLRMVNRGDSEDAAEQFMRWIFAAGIKLRGLERRRKAEKELFQSGTR